MDRGVNMDRRKALSLLGLGVLTGCGGGGGGGGEAAGDAAQGITTAGSTQDLASPAPAAPAARPSPIVPLSPSLAAWGDSITDLYVRSLAQVYPDRQVYNGGVVGQTSMQIAARLRADTAHRTWVSILWYGHNNWSKDEVKADIASSIAALAPNQAYVILSMLNWAPSGARGTQEYQDTVRVNGELAAMYPDHFLDIRQYLVGLYDPNSWQDVQDHQNDLPPSSLRFDGIHLNDAGCMVVARKVQEFLARKGW
jgi:lysophospholipase L1-like esterase